MNHPQPALVISDLCRGLDPSCPFPPSLPPSSLSFLSLLPSSPFSRLTQTLTGVSSLSPFRIFWFHTGTRNWYLCFHTGTSDVSEMLPATHFKFQVYWYLSVLFLMTILESLSKRTHILINNLCNLSLNFFHIYIEY